MRNIIQKIFHYIFEDGESNSSFQHKKTTIIISAIIFSVIIVLIIKDLLKNIWISKFWKIYFIQGLNDL